jgi:hypothetical protein
LTEPTQIELDSLFKEQNLYEVYRAAPSFFQKGSFNKRTVTVCSLALTAVALLHIFVPSIRDAFAFPFADTFLLLANTGAALSGTILGFLIAGFAILCTILRPQTMIALQKIRNKEFDCSELRLLFLVFVDVIIQYLALLFWSIAAIVMGGAKGIAAAFGHGLAKIHWLIPFILAHLLFVAWSIWLIMLVLTLKSFVFNLYQSLLLGIADAVDDYDREKRARPNGTT